MRFVDEYRDPQLARGLAAAILRRATRRWTIMEVCGGQTHAIVEHGLDQLIEPAVELLHGPGCPVCVTPLEALDRAAAIAEEAGAIVCTFGDMLRVPGSRGDLFAVRARGGDVRVVYAPLDAARLAERTPERAVVFLAVGFETTAPAVATAARWARARRLDNFFLLVSHVRVPPALDAIAAAPDTRVQAFLAAGHVCTVMGPASTSRSRSGTACRSSPPASSPSTSSKASRSPSRSSSPARRGSRSSTSAPCVRAAIPRRARSSRRSSRSRTDRGAASASCPRGGFVLRDAYRALDAERAFPGSPRDRPSPKPSACRAGEVLRGALRPPECPAFGRACTPDHPLGAPDGVDRRRLRGVLPLAGRARGLPRVSGSLRRHGACSLRIARCRPTIASA